MQLYHLLNPTIMEVFRDTPPPTKQLHSTNFTFLCSSPPFWATWSSPVARFATAPTMRAALKAPQRCSRTGGAKGRYGPVYDNIAAAVRPALRSGGVAPLQPAAQHPCSRQRDTPAAGGLAGPGLRFTMPYLLHLHIGQVTRWSWPPRPWPWRSATRTMAPSPCAPTSALLRSRDSAAVRVGICRRG